MNDQIFDFADDASANSVMLSALANAQNLANENGECIYVYRDDIIIRISSYFYPTRRLIRIIQPAEVS